MRDGDPGRKIRAWGLDRRTWTPVGVGASLVISLNPNSTYKVRSFEGWRVPGSFWILVVLEPGYRAGRRAEGRVVARRCGKHAYSLHLLTRRGVRLFESHFWLPHKAKSAKSARMKFKHSTINATPQSSES